jgi:hypothetical protein
MHRVYRRIAPEHVETSARWQGQHAHDARNHFRFLNFANVPCPPHRHSLGKIEKEKHFIKYDGELYVGDDVEKLRT